MLSKEENDFVRYWEENRVRRKKTVRQFLLGIPAGLLIVIPIVVSLVTGWYKRANMEANSQDFNPAVLLVALLLIVGFTAIFWQRHQWDQYEQRYRELLARRDRKEPVGAPSGAGSEVPLQALSEVPLQAGSEVPSEAGLKAGFEIDSQAGDAGGEAKKAPVVTRALSR
jgi:hypothetical protein